MKTYKQFVTEARELDEGLGTAAKIAMKGINKIAKKSFVKGLSKSMRAGPKFQSMTQKGTSRTAGSLSVSTAAVRTAHW